MRRLLFIALVLGSATCQEAPPEERPVKPPAQTKPPEVLVGGCDAWFANNICESKGPLKVWVEGDKPTEVRLPGWTASEPTEVRGGFRVTLQPGPVGARGALTYGPNNIQITHVTTTTTTPVLDALLEKMSMEELLELAPTLALDGRAVVLDLVRRRTVRSLGRTDGLAATQRQTGCLAAVSRARSDTIAQVRFGCLQSHIFGAQRDFDSVRDSLRQLPTYHPANSYSSSMTNYYRGILERQTGAPNKSLQHLSRTKLISERVGNLAFQIAAAQVMLPILETAGLQHLRPSIEAELLRPSNKLSCRSRGEVQTNIGWSRLLDREGVLGSLPNNPKLSPPASTSRATHVLQQALTLARECNGNVYNSLLNLAYDAIQRDDADSASTYLWQATRQRGREREPSIFQSLLESRNQLSQGHFATARVAYRKLLASESLTEFERWDATTGVAESYLNESVEEALGYFREAERLAAEARIQASFLSNRRYKAAATLRSSRAIVEILAESGSSAAAWQTARKARRRLAAIRTSALRLANTPAPLQTKVARVRGQLTTTRAVLSSLRSNLWASPSDQRAARIGQIREAERKVTALMSEVLEIVSPGIVPSQPRAPQAGEALVIIFPGLTRWWVIAHTQDTTLAASFKPAGIKTDYLAAFGKALEKVLPSLGNLTDVRFLATGEIADQDLHAAEVRGQPIGLQIPVSYQVDAPRQDTPHPNPSANALLLGDPAPHLDTASELKVIQASLTAGGASVLIPEGAELRHQALLAHLNTADIVHFSGHAERRQGPFQSRVRLGDSVWLTAGDIVLLPPLGRRIVLAGCETGAMAGEGSGWSLADAFIASGAREVLATTRRVDRGDARLIGLAAHTHDRPLSHQLHAAVRAMRKKDSDLDWSAYRVFVP